MKRTSIVVLIAVMTLAAFPHFSLACFDTYLFLQKGGMVYPYKMVAFDGSGEYTINEMRPGEPDLFTGNLNVYYGLAKGLSVQAVLTSSEKERPRFGFDEWGLRAVYSLVSQYRGVYNLDLILEHHTATDNGTSLYELSAPSIWHTQEFTFVLHPVGAFGHEMKFGLHGHGGVFYSMPAGATVGFGAEYESAQSSSNLGKRLVKGEAGTSLFFGSMLGANLFWQNELIKGWGAGSSRGDVGFAVTLKVLLQGGGK